MSLTQEYFTKLFLLKDNFRNKDVWFRLALSLVCQDDDHDKSPHSALQAFQECLRIDPLDPVPSLLAAKLILLDLDDPEKALEFALEAIERCKKVITDEHDISYRNMNEILTRSYLLAGIIHAHIYESSSESIRKLKSSHLTDSRNYLDLANKQSKLGDHLIYFHSALSEAKGASYKESIEYLRKAIELNPNHVPSFQLLIISLSAMKLYNEALILCESALNEFGNNLLLLYTKCNLEQFLVETKGHKCALNTAQYILKCIRSKKDNVSNQETTTTTTTINLFADQNGSKSVSISEESAIWFLVAEIFIKIGSLSDAEACVDEGSIHTNGALSHDILFTRGLISKERNNLMEAKCFFQSCLALNPKHYRALQQVGHVYNKLGDNSIAERFLHDSLDVEMNCPKTWHYLSKVYIDTKQHDKARNCEKKATLLEETCPIIPLPFVSRLTLQ